ncbi:MAG: hypothetical protein ACLVCH_12455 [Roseburia inulinivorans]
MEDIEGDLGFRRGYRPASMHRADHYQILAMDGEYSQLVVNEYGRGHGVYFAGSAVFPPELPYFCFGQSIMQPEWNRR